MKKHLLRNLRSRKTSLSSSGRGPLLLSVALLLFIFFPLFFVATREEQKKALPPRFTTTVDLKNREIHESPLIYEKGDFEAFFWKVGEPIRTVFGIAPSLLSASVGLSSEAVVFIREGMRREEVVREVAKKLSWGKDEKDAFLSILSEPSSLGEGKFLSGVYVLPLGTSPEEALHFFLEQFNEKVTLRYSPELEALVPLDTALTLASLVQRETGGYEEDMPLVAGIFWNRLFQDHRLESDVTLQYAKGNEKRGWWPRVYPKDKYISSPYNTYRNEGLPPTPIASPSLAALEATLNPEKTDCFYFLHDSNGGLHCSNTYKEHLALIEKHY